MPLEDLGYNVVIHTKGIVCGFEVRSEAHASPGQAEGSAEASGMVTCLLASNAFILTLKEQQRLAMTIWQNRTLLPDHLGFERQCCLLQLLQELHPLRLLQQQTDSDCRADLLPIFLHRILFHT